MKREQVIIVEMNWVLNRQLSWGALLLAAIVGIIEITSLISSIPNETPRTICAILVYLLSNPIIISYLALVFSIIVSLERVIIYTKEIINIKYALNKFDYWHFDINDASNYVSMILVKEGSNKYTIHNFRLRFLQGFTLLYGAWYLLYKLKILVSSINYIPFGLGIMSLCILFWYVSAKK